MNEVKVNSIIEFNHTIARVAHIVNDRVFLVPADESNDLTEVPVTGLRISTLAQIVAGGQAYVHPAI